MDPNSAKQSGTPTRANRICDFRGKSYLGDCSSGITYSSILRIFKPFIYIVVHLLTMGNTCAIESSSDVTHQGVHTQKGIQVAKAGPAVKSLAARCDDDPSVGTVTTDSNSHVTFLSGGTEGSQCSGQITTCSLTTSTLKSNVSELSKYPLIISTLRTQSAASINSSDTPLCDARPIHGSSRAGQPVPLVAPQVWPLSPMSSGNTHSDSSRSALFSTATIGNHVAARDDVPSMSGGVQTILTCSRRDVDNGESSYPPGRNDLPTYRRNEEPSYHDALPELRHDHTDNVVTDEDFGMLCDREDDPPMIDDESAPATSSLSLLQVYSANKKRIQQGTSLHSGRKSVVSFSESVNVHYDLPNPNGDDETSDIDDDDSRHMADPPICEDDEEDGVHRGSAEDALRQSTQTAQSVSIRLKDDDSVADDSQRFESASVVISHFVMGSEISSMTSSTRTGAVVTVALLHDTTHREQIARPKI